MNWTFRVASIISDLTYSYAFCAKWLNSFNNGEINEVGIEWTLKKEYKNERRTDKTRTKLTQTALTTPTSIDTHLR